MVLSGFALAFHMLLPNSDAFNGPLSSMMKVLVMMIGEFDFEDNFSFEKIKELSYGGRFGESSNGTVHILFILFVIFVSLILSNLIVGLTVNKTEELFCKADLHHTIKTIRQIHSLESLMVNGPFLPSFFRRQNVQLLPKLRDGLVTSLRTWTPNLKKRLRRDRTTTGERLVTSSTWSVCVYVNDEHHRKRRWYKALTSPQDMRATPSAAESDFDVFYYDNEANKRMHKCGFRLPYEIVQSSLRMAQAEGWFQSPDQIQDPLD